MSDMQQLVDLAISLNLKSRKFKKEIGVDKTMSKMTWMKQCTVYIDFGRRTGKTTYIMNNADFGDCIFVSNRSTKQEILARSKNQILRAKNIFAFNTDNLDQFRGHNMFRICERVYVDEPRLVFRRKDSIIQQFYELFYFNEFDPTFIFLGET